MSLVKWEPLTGIWPVERELDQLFEGFFGESPPPPTLGEPHDFAPSVDIIEQDKSLVVKAELPGIPKEAIEVTAADDLLTIHAESKDESEVKRDGYCHHERRFGSFSRTIALPEGIDYAGIKATHKDGVLEIRLPKTEPAEPEVRRIPVD